VDRILKFLEDHREDMLEDLRLFVEAETPSTDKPLLDAFAKFLAGQAASVADGQTEIVPSEGSGDHVRARWGDEEAGPPILLLGHYDTVWSADTLEKMPFAVRDGRAAGPGVFDMKCGLVRACDVGVVNGGTRYNVVAAEAVADVDVRIVKTAEAERLAEIVSGLEAHHPGATVSVEGGQIWPPMERTQKPAELFGHARRLAAELGFELDEGFTGGASDGCLCAALGVPTLDGLGAVGGAHAAHERVIIATIPQRAALVARLLETLGNEP
jgi:acetylornithine deacetylase/succinyl-diaminopimelate desuccinylase-like protein